MVNESEPGLSKSIILFLCSHNAARSQMAEAFLKKYAGNRYEVYSAGLAPTQVHPLTTLVMGEAGIDISSQQAKGLRQFLGKLAVNVAIILCEPEEKDCPRVWPGALRQESWPFPDPAVQEGTEEERLARFRDVRDRIHERILTWLKEIAVE